MADQAILAKIKELTASAGRPVLVALDGRTGVGKSTTAPKIAALIAAVVVPGDDFYIRRS